jgi:D-alanyl-D-alanine carboxypeptidase (penicillin-binding protein 5/6)
MTYKNPYKKSHRGLGITAGIIVLLAGLASWNVLRPIAAVAITQNQITIAPQTTADLAWPGVGEAAVEVKGITPLLTHGIEKAVPTASMAKVITALVVLQKYPLASAKDLGQTITLSQADVDIYNAYVAQDGSVVRVAPGEQLNEYQALQAMLLPSANNVADSFAIWAFGSLDAYKVAAQAYLKSLGLNDTTIGADASGLDPGTTSTPSDMVRIGEQAISNPALADIMAQRTATIPIEGQIFNVNADLGKSGIFGIKTGNSDQVGGNLLFAAKTAIAGGKSATVVGVVMDQNSLQGALDAAPTLVDSVAKNLYVATPIKAGQVVATYTTAWGAAATAAAKEDLSFVAWKGETITPKVSLQHSSVSYETGATVGTVSASSKDGTGSATADVVMQSSLSGPTFWWRLTRH